LIAVKAAAIIFVVEFLQACTGGEEVIHVLRELNTLAGGKFLEGFSEWFPSNGVKRGVVPR
jgi:hypothetical protein